MAMRLDEFLKLSMAERREYLRDPAWPVRCRCGRYGIPWEFTATLRGEDGLTHTIEVCAPDAEFL
jgi:hypothetical protein